MENNRKIKALIFDADGTLADTIGAITTAINRMLQKNGFPQHTQDEIRSFIGNGAVMLVRRALPSEYYNNDPEVHKYYDLYNREYAVCYLDTRSLYPHLGETIARLSQDYKIGVLSNKDHFILKPLVEQLLQPYCTHFWVQGPTNQLPTKPNKEITMALLDSMQVNPDECIMIGDSDVDYKTAMQANMKHIGVTWGFRDESFLLQAGVQHLAHSPQELESIIQRLNT